MRTTQAASLAALLLSTLPHHASVVAQAAEGNGIDGQGIAGEQPLMYPTIHWDTPTDALHMLLPSNSSSLYFTPTGQANPDEAHDFATVNTNNTYPVVVLAHTQYVDTVTCDTGAFDITLKCSDSEAFGFVSSHWPTSPPFVAATLTQGCGQSMEQHSFFLVTNVTLLPDSQTVRLTYSQQLEIHEIFAQVEVKWGRYLPTSNLRKRNNIKASKPVLVASPSSTSSGSVFVTNVPPAGGVTEQTCGPPPTPFIDGLRTATCGSPTFDRDLDAAIGFLNFSQADYSASLQSFAPGLGDFAIADNTDFGPALTKRDGHLYRRNLGNRVQEAIAKAKNKVKMVGQAATQAVGNFVDRLTTAVSDALALTPAASCGINLNIGPANNVNSVFGRAKSLYSGSIKGANGNAAVNVYCVDCGVRGQIVFSGMARYTIKNGLVSGNANLNGNVAATLQIGLDVAGQYNYKERYPLLALAAPPGFAIVGVFVVGPSLALNAVTEIKASAQAQILAGARLSIPDFSASLDLVDGSKSVSNIQPRFDRIFRASGIATASASLGFPLSIGLAFEIPPIRFGKTAALFNKPYVGATVLAQADSNGGSIGSCGNGVQYNIQVGNQIYVDIFGLYTKSLTDIPIASTGQCFKLGSGTSVTTVPRRRLARADRLRRDVDVPVDEGEFHADDNDPFPFAFVTDSSPNSTVNIPDFQQLSNASLAFADSINVANSSGAIGANSSAFGVATQDANATLVTIKDTSGAYVFAADALTGNVFLLNASVAGNASFFTETSPGGAVIADGTSIDFAHYYPDVMAKYNVSRLRFTNYTNIAQTADLVGFLPTTVDASKPPVYVGYDTNIGGPFLPVTCEYVDPKIPAKVFLAMADSIQASLTKLLDPSLRYTVTGGVVQECFYVPWNALV